MYIARTKKKYKDTYHEQILLRESYREDGKVKSRTLLNLTNKPKEQVEAIAFALTNKEDINLINTQEQQFGKTIGFSFILLHLLKSLGISSAFNSLQNTPSAIFESKIARMLIAVRVIAQGSRLQALYFAKEQDKILDLLEFTKSEERRLNDKNIYLGLDYMEKNQERIEDALYKSYYKDNPPKKVYYDVTSSYVEGDYKNSELVRFGYNRDGKKGKQQIVIGLLTDEEGRAISIHTYPGNTNDVKTFANQLEKLKKRFNLENITIVGDGGMIKSEDIKTIKELGYNYITTIGKASIRALIDNKASKLDLTLFDEELSEVIDKDESGGEGVRYILRQNPTRRDEIRKRRKEKIEHYKACINAKIEYYNTHLNAKKETLESYIEKKTRELKLSNFLSYNITYTDGTCKTRKRSKKGDKEEEILKEKGVASISFEFDTQAQNIFESLDGCYVIKTSLIDKSKDSKEDIHVAYKALIKVENAFKTLKTDFLEIRPLYLKTDKRIKGHVALSMMAYNITLKLKEYINKAGLDFRSTVNKLATLSTMVNKINNAVTFETIPRVSGDLQKLFDVMQLKLPTKL